MGVNTPFWMRIRRWHEDIDNSRHRLVLWKARLRIWWSRAFSLSYHRLGVTIQFNCMHKKTKRENLLITSSVCSPTFCNPSYLFWIDVQWSSIQVGVWRSWCMSEHATEFAFSILGAHWRPNQWYQLSICIIVFSIDKSLPEKCFVDSKNSCSDPWSCNY